MLAIGQSWQYYSSAIEILQFYRSQSLGWSTELLSTYSAEGSLRRTRTLESLNTLDDDDDYDNETAELGQDDSGNYSQQVNA